MFAPSISINRDLVCSSNLRTRVNAAPERINTNKRLEGHLYQPQAVHDQVRLEFEQALILVSAEAKEALSLVIQAKIAQVEWVQAVWVVQAVQVVF